MSYNKTLRGFWQKDIRVKNQNLLKIQFKIKV